MSIAPNGPQARRAYRLGPKERSLSKKLLLAGVLLFVGGYGCGWLLELLPGNLGLGSSLVFLAWLIAIALLIASLIVRLVMGKPQRE